MTGLALKITIMPFIRILVPVIAGILAASVFDIPAWVLWSALSVSFACAFFTVKHGRVGWFYIFMSLALTAAAITKTHQPKALMPYGEKLLLQLEITGNPAPQGRWMATTAETGYFRPYDGGQWRKANQKILLNVCPLYDLPVGSRLVCAAYVNATGMNGYARLMHTRGYSGKSYITQGNIVALSPEKGGGLRASARRMQAAATKRLAGLNISADEAAVAAAMALGEKRALSASLKQSYSRVGASHLLAVSGLHVGIVFVLINILLYFLPLAGGGHIAKNLAAIAAIWVYAAVTGLSPSAFRAALMFTGVQLSLAATLHRDTLNILAATAVVMLLVWPGNLYDVSFQLSMAAVLFISLFYKPLYGLMRTRYGLVNALAGITAVSVAATAGTAPLAAHYFGNFPVAGIAINPVVILTAHAVVFLSMVWIVFPADLLEPVMGWLIQGAARVQNALIEWSAGLAWSSLKLNLSSAGVICIYIAYFAIFIALNLKKGKTSFAVETQ